MLLTPRPQEWYQYPAMSPDGRSLAFVACAGAEWGSNCHPAVVGLTGSMQPAGSPRTLTREAVYFRGVTWPADGRSLICSAGSNTGNYLWRVAVDPPVRPVE